VYPLQNRRASKSATHGFASKSDTCHSKKHLRKQVLFATMCSAYAERDAPFGRDVDFVSDVRFAREESGTHHITLRLGAIHHCASAQHHCGVAATSLIQL